jgi:hypothetical protein
MDTIDLRGVPGNEIIIRFDVPYNEVDATTFTEVIAGFSQAPVQIGLRVDPHNPIEVQLAGVSYGSVLARLRLTPMRIAVGVASLVALPMVTNILSAYIYDAWKAVDPSITVSIDRDAVTFQTPDIKVIIDRKAFDKAGQIKWDPQVVQGLVRAIRAAEKDKRVKSVSVLSPTCPVPFVTLPKSQLREIANTLEEPELGDALRSRPKLVPDGLSERFPPQEARSEPDRVQLIIISAVFYSSRAKWRFRRPSGASLAAAISDLDFYQRVERREVSLASGDALDVDLIAEVSPAGRSAYEILKVHGIIAGIRPTLPSGV